MPHWERHAHFNRHLIAKSAAALAADDGSEGIDTPTTCRPVRSGLRPGTAAPQHPTGGEIIWTPASPNVGRLFCDEIGLTEAQHARWLTETQVRTLLPDN
jgi:hypothetical protein